MISLLPFLLLQHQIIPETRFNLRQIAQTHDAVPPCSPPRGALRGVHPGLLLQEAHPSHPGEGREGKEGRSSEEAGGREEGGGQEGTSLLTNERAFLCPRAARAAALAALRQRFCSRAGGRACAAGAKAPLRLSSFYFLNHPTLSHLFLAPPTPGPPNKRSDFGPQAAPVAPKLTRKPKAPLPVSKKSAPKAAPSRFSPKGMAAPGVSKQRGFKFGGRTPGPELYDDGLTTIERDYIDRGMKQALTGAAKLRFTFNKQGGKGFSSGSD